MFRNRGFKLASLLSVFVVIFSMAAVDYAEARARGGFGSRGGRTFAPPASTQTIPGPAAPINRTMTPSQPGTAARTPAQQTAQPRGGFFNGFGGSLFRGLMLGGLFGLLLGTGFGGIGGFMSLLFQALLIGGAIWLVMRLVRGTNRPATANGAPYMGREANATRPMPNFGGGSATRTPAQPKNPDELGITNKDLDTFEQMLGHIQTAYGREDYAALRQVTTPEMMGFLAEELASNASRGQINRLSDIKLLQGDVSESWREGNTEYATVAMRYQLRDWSVERTSDRVVAGDPEVLEEAKELWTFVRQVRGDWKLSAIQEA
ncbi:TIM44-like domain-containing protein [Devosia aurantiaca]|uniref:Tim44 domain-containing protein n=1 Tax=Devosia aurantiaca TaxID=2714858 RepID=A0A6M1SN24_9HYPH|nr:Tim44 domain-containing protein [Devosia aurantiaca]NGP17936.1 Tim44 domain-containing protein [Devosia aurantiaca]